MRVRFQAVAFRSLFKHPFLNIQQPILKLSSIVDSSRFFEATPSGSSDICLINTMFQQKGRMYPPRGLAVCAFVHANKKNQVSQVEAA